MPPDIAGAAPRVAVEEGGTVEDEADLGAFAIHLGELMQQKQHGAVAHVGKTGGIASRRTQLVLGLYLFADVFPVLAEGWVGEHVVE